MPRKKSLLRSPHFRSLMILWGATAVSILIIFYPFLFGDSLVVFNDAGSDTRQQYLMQYATIANHLRNGNFSLWDMSLGFGASMFALNPFNLFLIPVYLGGAVLGIGHIPTLLLAMLIVQFFLAGTFCYLFLNCFSLSEPGKVISSYLYAFSGYLLVWGQHYHFGAFAVFLPLLLFLLERAMQRRRFSPAVPLMIAVMVCSGTYMSYMSFLMAGAFLLGRAILEDGTPAFRVRLFLARCGEILLGLGLGAVFFLPSARFLLTVSTRLDRSSSLPERLLEYCSLFPAEFYRTAFLRFFSTTFEGIARYNGYSNFYEAPVLFFSALFVILLPQYIVSVHRQKTSRKARMLSRAAILFFVFCMFVRLGAAAFNAFAYPFSRHSFVFMPLFALLTARALDEICVRRRLSLPALAVSAALVVCACGIALHQLPDAESANLRGGVLATGALALLMAVFLVLLCHVKNPHTRLRRTAAMLLFLCVIANVCGEGWLCYNERDVLTTTDAGYWGTLYDPDVEAALAWIGGNDPSFIRTEKTYYAGSYCMDGLAQGYRGISAYNSTPNRNIEEFVNLVIPNFPIMAQYEYTFRQIGYYTGHSTLFGIRYLLSRDASPAPDGYRQIGRFGEIRLYQNEEVSSFARFYTKTGNSSVLRKAYGKADLETMLLDVALLDTDGEASGAGDSGAEQSGAAALAQKIIGEAPCSSDELLSGYALEEIAALGDLTADGTADSIPIRIDRSLLADYTHVYLEFDIETPAVCDFALNPGSSMEYLFRTKAGEVSHVQMPVPDFCKIFQLHSYTGPFRAQIRNLRLLGSKAVPAQTPQADIMVENTQNDSHLSGTISTEENGFLFFPLPYEDGWTATLDGGETELLRTDIGFVSIPVTAGEHSFTLTYRQPWMRTGFYVSAFSLILWAVLTVLEKRKKNHTAKNRRTTAK